MGPSDSKDEKRRGIQSVEIGVRVLNAVARNAGPSPLSAIAEETGLSPSQTHRYLTSLIASGMVKRDGPAGSYNLDAGAIRLGLAALSRLDSFALADDACRALARTSARTTMLSVWGDSGPVVVRWFNGDPPVITSLGIGSILPLLSSATGLVFFAFLDNSAVSALARKELRAPTTPAPAIEGLRAQIRAARHANVEGELIPGLRAMSAPVFDLQGELRFAVTLIANARVSPESDPEAERQLIRSCTELTEALGGQWP